MINLSTLSLQLLNPENCYWWQNGRQWSIYNYLSNRSQKDALHLLNIRQVYFTNIHKIKALQFQVLDPRKFSLFIVFCSTDLWLINESYLFLNEFFYISILSSYLIPGLGNNPVVVKQPRAPPTINDLRSRVAIKTSRP